MSLPKSHPKMVLRRINLIARAKAEANLLEDSFDDGAQDLRDFAFRPDPNEIPEFAPLKNDRL